MVIYVRFMLGLMLPFALGLWNLKTHLQMPTKAFSGQIMLGLRKNVIKSDKLTHQ